MFLYIIIYNIFIWAICSKCKNFRTSDFSRSISPKFKLYNKIFVKFAYFQRFTLNLLKLRAVVDRPHNIKSAMGLFYALYCWIAI